MTEINEIPFIKDKEYLQTHDLCDIYPGLSEYQNNKNNEIKEKEKEKNKENIEDKNIEKKEVDLEDDIFKKIDIENEHTYLTEIFKIIKNSIDGAIIFLSIENYYKLENFEIIAKLHIKLFKKKFQIF